MDTVRTTAKVRLEIENTYELYDAVTTHADAEINLPIPDKGSDEYDEWAQDNIFPHTGVGHTDGNSWYDVEITESSVPELVGMTFEFGY